MTVYEDVLTDAEILAVLSYIKAQWPKDLKERHDEMNAMNTRSQRKMNRRGFLIAGLGAALSNSLPAFAAAKPKLQMPPLLDTTGSGRLALKAIAGKTDFLGSGPTTTIGFNQPYLGPTVRLQPGPLAVEVSNTLAEPITAHWHGLLVPGENDGGPHSVIEPGSTWSPDLDIDQPSTTAWYHTHLHQQTAAQVYAGLAGVIHVTDGRDDDRGLPSRYGVDDLTLVLQDRRFDRWGRMTYRPSMMDTMRGFLGNVMLVNGQVGAAAVVPKGVARLRLLNGSNARIYDLFMNDSRPFHLVATDGGFLPKPVALQTILLSPGERVEVLVDFSSGQPAELMSHSDPNSQSFGVMGQMGGFFGQSFDRPFPVLSIAIDNNLPTGRIDRIPESLDGMPPDLDDRDAPVRQFSLDMGMGSGMMGRRRMMRGRGMMGGLAINGHPFNMNRIDLQNTRGTVERWVVNSEMLAHPFHVHGVRFQVVRTDGRAPEPALRGWKDTVLVRNQTEILVHFDQQASREHPFVYHCHILEHEDGGMMGQFTVT